MASYDPYAASRSKNLRDTTFASIAQDHLYGGDPSQAGHNLGNFFNSVGATKVGDAAMLLGHGYNAIKTGVQAFQHGIGKSNMLQVLANKYLPEKYAQHIAPFAATMEARKNGDLRDFGTILSEKAQDHLNKFTGANTLRQVSRPGGVANLIPKLPQAPLTQKLLDLQSSASKANDEYEGARARLKALQEGGFKDLTGDAAANAARDSALQKGLGRAGLSTADIDKVTQYDQVLRLNPALAKGAVPQDLAHLPQAKQLQSAWATAHEATNGDATRAASHVLADQATDVLKPDIASRLGETTHLDLQNHINNATAEVQAYKDHANQIASAYVSEKQAGLQKSLSKVSPELRSYYEKNAPLLDKLHNHPQGISSLTQKEVGTLLAEHPDISQVGNKHVNDAVNSIGRRLQKDEFSERPFDMERVQPLIKSHVVAASKAGLKDLEDSLSGNDEGAKLAKSLLSRAQTGNFRDGAHDLVEFTGNRIKDPSLRHAIRSGLHATINDLGSEDSAQHFLDAITGKSGAPKRKFQDFLNDHGDASPLSIHNATVHGTTKDATQDDLAVMDKLKQAAGAPPSKRVPPPPDTPTTAERTDRLTSSLQTDATIHQSAQPPPTQQSASTVYKPQTGADIRQEPPPPSTAAPASGASIPTAHKDEGEHDDETAAKTAEHAGADEADEAENAAKSLVSDGEKTAEKTAVKTAEHVGEAVAEDAASAVDPIAGIAQPIADLALPKFESLFTKDKPTYHTDGALTQQTQTVHIDQSAPATGQAPTSASTNPMTNV